MGKKVYRFPLENLFMKEGNWDGPKTRTYPEMKRFVKTKEQEKREAEAKRVQDLMESFIKEHDIDPKEVLNVPFYRNILDDLKDKNLL